LFIVKLEVGKHLLPHTSMET